MLTKDLQSLPFHQSSSAWARSFTLRGIKCLIVCRGPVRKEAFDVFDAIGVREYGMLLSQKDSVVYPGCLAPELRSFKYPKNIHRVRDYMGAGQQEKIERIEEIIAIAVSNGYTHMFAGYGFMAEDAEFLQAIQDAGLGFIGPSARVARHAGAKDEAKVLARSLGNAVIPGIDNVSALALCKKAKDRKALEKLVKEFGLSVTYDAERSLEENAETILLAGYAKNVELVTIPELQSEAEVVSKKLWQEYPGKRIRFKHIGGGGGKGQRVIAKPVEVASAVVGVLSESKVTAPGSNRNFLIELNLESTRHNEIQLVGNGEWCIALGGRDCSVQMHEQKLLEVSLTQELLDCELASAKGKRATTLRKDKQTLARMEEEGERFGAATGLDSVSTFECIVDGFDHFFMEMNTRIQVEHRVTELVYSMKFTNPDDPEDFFYINRLIEAMALLSVHGKRLPRPERIPQNVSGAEARINATNAALQPHAGGIIKSWSPPIDGEIRDDQGIGMRNPDTGTFMFYNMAGAYDSNIALVLTHGENRRDNLERMLEILRRTELRGDSVETNLSMHYGLCAWLLGKEPMLKPSTHFMKPYLAAVGALRQVTCDVDVALAGRIMHARQPNAEAERAIDAKQTLLLRPIERLLADSHKLAGFLGRYEGELWSVEGKIIRFLRNPVTFLDQLYHFLHMEYAPGKPASEMIWDHDRELMDKAKAFYAQIEKRAGVKTWDEIEALFAGREHKGVSGGSAELWKACVASHRGFQVGLELLTMIPRIGIRAGFNQIRVNRDTFEVEFPERFLSEEASLAIRALAPAPIASAKEIVAPSGGAFYGREAPHLPLLIEEGQHFEAGDPLFIIEVMKMFNKVYAPFAGTITRCLLKDSDGSIVKAGQRIFEIEPDQMLVEETAQERNARRKKVTTSVLPPE